MNVTPGVYPDFTVESSLEALTLSMCRLFLSRQKDLTTNPSSLDIIDITTDEEAATIDVGISGLEAEISNGALLVADPFPGPFTPGAGAYPYDRATLADAIAHLLLYQKSAEFSAALNDLADRQYVGFSIAPGTRGANAKPYLIDVNLTNYPIAITYSGGAASSTAAPYLNTP